MDSGRIPNAEIVAVVSDVAGAPGLARARKRGLPAYAFDRGDFPDRSSHEKEILRVLKNARPDLVCLAGYMRILSPGFVARFRGRILNIHPALLPKFPGLDAQRRALEAGETESGCTVHFVDEGTDTGPIVLQKKVPVRPGDSEESLSARILEIEHATYPEAIARVARGASVGRRILHRSLCRDRNEGRPVPIDVFPFRARSLTGRVAGPIFRVPARVSGSFEIPCRVRRWRTKSLTEGLNFAILNVRLLADVSMRGRRKNGVVRGWVPGSGSLKTE